MKRWIAWSTAAAICMGGLIVLANWYSVQPEGDDTGLWLALLIVPLVGLAVLVVPIFLIAALFARPRRLSLRGAYAAIVTIVAFVLALKLGASVRMAGFRELAERSMPLVHAIERYEADHGVPPRRLDNLVPDYVPSIPGTGLRAYPHYELIVGSNAAYYENNPWVLLVSTPSGGINFDLMAYFPRQNYPAVGQSGWWEPVGKWAYLHE